MSDKLTLSATISVLLMTAYALFGGDVPRASFGPAGYDAPERIAVALPPLNFVLARAGSRHILY